MIIRAAALVPMPWKNGGGVTREIATEPPGASLDAFAWRISVADVARDGAFSIFPGVDRVLVLLDGAGMRLTQADGGTHVLDEPLAIAHFAGETPIDATLLDGPTRDFNIMVRRDRARAHVRARRGAHALAPEHAVTLIYCAHGRLDVTLDDKTRTTLETGDTLRLMTNAGCIVSGEASWLQIGIDMS